MLDRGKHDRPAADQHHQTQENRESVYCSCTPSNRMSQVKASTLCRLIEVIISTVNRSRTGSNLSSDTAMMLSAADCLDRELISSFFEQEAMNAVTATTVGNFKLCR